MHASRTSEVERVRVGSVHGVFHGGTHERHAERIVGIVLRDPYFGGVCPILSLGWAKSTYIHATDLLHLKPTSRATSFTQKIPKPWLHGSRILGSLV